MKLMTARDTRKYRVKNAKVHFFCPLCSVERALRYRSRLSQRQYVQVGLTSIVMMLATFGLMEEKVFFWPFVIWASFEFFNKMLFRKEIPCPHCGFDATWYRRNVKVARKLVHDFWQPPGPVPKT